MRFRWLVVSVGCTLSFGASGIIGGCSDVAPKPERSDEATLVRQAIQGGTDDGVSHPYAVGVCAGGSKGNCQGICSGALILPNLVVTARHCVQQTPKQINCTLNPPVRFGAAEGVQWVTTNSKMFQTTLGWHHVKSIVVPPDDKVCGNDIALITLDSPIPDSEAVPVIPGVQYAMGDIDLYPSHSYTAIGYGKISPKDPPPSAQCFTASSDYTVCPGARRIRQGIPVVCIPGDEYIPCPVDPAISDDEFVAGDGTCEGDSGSSAFETYSFQKGQPITFGVLSRGGTSADGLTCTQTIYSRLDKWRDFVVQAAMAASANWTLYPKPIPDWTVFVPSKPDGGAPEAGPPKKPTNVADGETCAKNEECKSKLCADTGAGLVCALSCDGSVPNSCVAGFVCKTSICVIDAAPAPPPAATSKTTTTSGCSVGPAGMASGPTDAPWRAVGLSAALGLALVSRRGRPRPGTPS